MKRYSPLLPTTTTPEYPSSSSSSSSNLSATSAFRKVFRIIPSPSLHSKSGHVLNEAIFQQMNNEEKRRCFQRQAYEIKQLRRKLRKCANDSRIEFDSLEPETKRAQMLLQSVNCELPDQKEMIENLIKAVNTGKLVPETLPFSRISTILRNGMENGKEVDKSKAEHVTFPEKSVAISKKESNQYKYLPKSEQVYRALVGDDIKSSKADTSTISLDQTTSSEESLSLKRYLITQGELLKEMTFEDFLRSIWKQKSSR